MYSLDYSEIVRDRFEKPRNAGRLFGPVVTGSAGDEARGTRVEFDFRLRDGVVERGRFRAYGCPHAIAASSWAVSYTHLTLPTNTNACRSRWSPEH